MSATVLSGEPVAPDRTRRMEAPHQPPVGRPLWSENYAWVCYDPVRQAGVLLHLGRMPFDPLLWRSTVVAYLPAGRLVVAKGVAPSPDARPGNANLTLTCQRPLQQWSLAYVGAGRPTSHDTLGAGRLIDDALVDLRIDLTFDHLTPIWDLGQAMDLGETHYEQFGRFRGTVRAAGETFDLDCPGYRDHTTGRRDLSGLGSHVWTHAYFPSGRAFCAFRASTPDGAVALNKGAIFEGDRVVTVAPIGLPGLDDSAGAPSHVTIQLPETSPITARTVHGSPFTLGEPNDFHFGVDLTLSRKVMVDCPSDFEWDGEVAHGWLERSAVLPGVGTEATAP